MNHCFSEGFFIIIQKMERDDLVKTLVCPAWGLSSWHSKEAEKKQLYGGSKDDKDAMVGGTIFLIVMLLFGVLTVCGVVKAFMCGSSSTNLGGSGFIWGLLGLFIPLPAIIFLFAGHCQV